MLRSTSVRLHVRSSVRRAFTLVEILVVIACLSAMVLFGAGISSNVLTAVRVKGSAEQLMWELRGVQQFAMARGAYAVPAPAGSSGICFFAQRVNNLRTGADATPGFSYVSWGADMRNKAVYANPGATGIQAAKPYLPYIVNLPLGVTLAHQDGTAVVNGDRVEFTQTGDLVPGSLPVVLLNGPDLGPFTITMWGEDTAAAGIPDKPRSIMLQAP